MAQLAMVRQLDAQVVGSNEGRWSSLRLRVQQGTPVCQRDLAPDLTLDRPQQGRVDRRPLVADLGGPDVGVVASVVRHPEELTVVRAEEKADLVHGKLWPLRRSAHRHRQGRPCVSAS